MTAAMTVTVTSQVELDAALKAKTATIYITSPKGVWLTVREADSSHVEAWGSSHVEAWDSSHVVAWDSSHVEAWGSSHVVAWDSSHVEAWDSSHVEAWDSSHVEARGSSHVVARPLVAVHLHSTRATVEGGVLIDITAIDQSDPATWCDMQGVDIEKGRAIIYKAVDADLKSGRRFTYPLGETVEAPDWRKDDSCGGGLHFGPTPRHAKNYFAGATRFLAVSIPVKAAVGITDGGPAKIKARSCTVLHEVTIDGEPVKQTASTS